MKGQPRWGAGGGGLMPVRACAVSGRRASPSPGGASPSSGLMVVFVLGSPLPPGKCSLDERPAGLCSGLPCPLCQKRKGRCGRK